MRQVASFLSISLLFASVLSAAQPPNFVLIYFDDLGWAETSVEMIEGREDIESKEAMDLAMQHAADEDIAAESKETAAKIAE